MYFGVNVNVLPTPPNSSVEILPAPQDGIRWWGLCSDGILGLELLSGISALVGEAPEKVLIPSTREP